MDWARLNRALQEVHAAADRFAVQGLAGNDGDPLPAGLSADAARWIKANQSLFRGYVETARKWRLAP